MTCPLCGCPLQPTNTRGICGECWLLARNGDLPGVVLWAAVPWDARYEVSSEAEVRDARSKHPIPTDRSGRYDRVTLGGKRWYLHDVVLAAFVGPKPPGQLVLHRDDHGDNPRIANLSYGSPAENQIDAVRNGRRSQRKAV